MISYHYCLALLLERFTFFLEQKQVRGDVMAESRGGKEDKRLKLHFQNCGKKELNMYRRNDFTVCLRVNN